MMPFLDLAAQHASLGDHFFCRSAARQALADAGIKTMVHYPVPPYRQEAYREMEMEADSFPIADRIHNEVLSLPLHPLMTTADVSRVAAILKKAGR